MRDDSAQMMLLTAVILVLGFIALAGLAARLDQIPDEAALVRDDVFFDEVGVVLDAMDTAVVGLNMTGSGPDTPEFLPFFAGAMRHLELIEAGRGHRLVVEAPTCASLDTDGDGTDDALWVNATFRLASPAAGIGMEFSHRFNGFGCA